MADAARDIAAPIRDYKAVLLAVLETRPSGTRQRLADALGKHRSFVTQIAGPAYATPIPHRHLATIFAVCHFSPSERETFMAAYRRAHRGKPELVEAAQPVRQVTLTVPDFGDAARNAAFDTAVASFITTISGLVGPGGGDQ